MGYFFSQTWMWWLLAIVLAVAITWLLFRERKHKDKLAVNDRRAYGERGLAGGADAKLEGKEAKREAKLERKEAKREAKLEAKEAKVEAKEGRAGAHLGNQFDAGYEGERGRLGADAGRLEGERGQFQGDAGRFGADADRTRVDNPIDPQGVNIPGQHRSLKERAEELKDKAEARTGRRKFF